MAIYIFKGYFGDKIASVKSLKIMVLDHGYGHEPHLDSSSTTDIW